MFSKKMSLKFFVGFTVLTLLVSCSEKVATSHNSANQQSTSEKIALDGYKSLTCGCCKKWISHIDEHEHEFELKIHNRKDVSLINNEKGIEPRYRSSHTAISKDGNVFEGHIAAKFIQEFMKEAHNKDVIGMSVPSMRTGFPGMDVGDRFQAYKVLLLTSYGSYETYASAQSYEEIF
jgi:hypothetical protein